MMGMTDFDSEPDGPMTPDEEAQARSLTAAELQRIDAVLLSHTTDRRKKVAMVVFETMRELSGEFPHLPDVFYGHRVKHLAESGMVESAGNLDRMRFSEIQLAQKRPSAER